MLISSFAEIISLGSVVPFIGVITQPETIFQYTIVAKAAEMFSIEPTENLVLPLTIIFATSALFSGGVRMLMLWVSIRLANATGADLSIEVYRRTLYQPYSVHIERSSSEIISGITQKIATATGVLRSLVTVVISITLFGSIISTLLFIDHIVAMVSIISFGCFYGVIIYIARRRLLKNSESIAREQTQVVKVLQEGLGGIRDVLLDRAQPLYCATYSKSVQKLQLAESENTYINQAPRYAMETVGMIMIAGLAYFLSYNSGGVAAALPLLGAMALGAQRGLPLMQALYGNWVVVAASNVAIKNVLNLLEQPLPEDIYLPEPNSLKFQNLISLENMSFRYSNSGDWILNGINLTIHKGSRVGFIGSTGSGKSTMFDLIMVLLDPTDGIITVDGKRINDKLKRAWQRTIVHVPQNIFLSDATISENIAFGVPPNQIDNFRVRKSAAKAQIAEFIESHPDGYKAIVGERGIKLSGGQRQRIAIARAFYKEANVLILDEATSALDNTTENAVMKVVDSLSRDMTVLIIAHRLTTLRNCDTIIQLENGKIVSQDFYSKFAKKERISQLLEKRAS